MLNAIRISTITILFVLVFRILPAAAQSGPVAAYGFNETAGITASDATGNGRTGTVSGAVWTGAGRFGGALSFDGVNDRVNIADHALLDLTTGMTLEAWVYPTALSGYRTVILKERTAELAYGLYANEGAARPAVWIAASSQSSAAGTTSLPLNTWTHLAATYDGATIRLFVNGSQVGSRAQTGSIFVSTNQLRIGGNAIWGEYFAGRIDEVRIYARALSSTEIQTDMIVPVLPPDTTPPTVAISSPAPGATVSGTINIAATANDAVGVTGVQFFIDGVAVGAEDTSSPYAIAVDTSTMSNGAHQLTARARDAAGNTTTSTAVSVTVSNVPRLVITSPAPGASVNGSTIPVTYTTAGDLTGFGVDHVHFHVDGGPERMDTSFDGVYQLLMIPGGTHVLTGFLVRGDHSKINGTDATPVSFSNVVPDTTAPTVTMTAPANGAASKGTITVSADAADEVGVVGVQFLLDGAPLGAEDTTAPYSVSWATTGATNGAHTLSARARDAATNQATATSVAVTVDNTAPTVSITAPANSATIGGLVTVTADAADTGGVGGVQFLLDGAPLGAEDTTAPYTVDWATAAAANGGHVLSARARDIAGNTTTSSDVSVTVDNAAPTVAVTAPANDATVSGAVTLSADATDAVGVVGVQFLLDGAPVGAEDTSAPYAIDWATTAVTDGAHTISARARDAAANSTTSSDVTVTVDNTAPTVAITAPANGATINGTFTLSADAADAGGVTGVQFLLDGAPLGAEDTSAPYTLDWATTGVPDGAHTIGARARDGAGNTTTSSSVTATVDNAAPTVALTAPANGAAINGSFTLSADAADEAGVVGVQFLLDGAPLGVEDTAAPYTIDWATTSVPNGAYALSARARDAVGNTTTSSSVAVTVDNDTTAPTVAMSAPANGATVSGAVTLSADATDAVGVVGVQFLLDGASLGAEDTAAPYTIEWATSAVANGAHTLSARARDAAGNSATSSAIAVTADNDTTAPNISMTAPVNGASVKGTITIAADASDAVGVVGVQFLLDGAALDSEDTTPPYSIDWVTTATSGAHTLSARARDAAGNETTAAGVAVTIDNVAPTVTIAAPANGATVDGIVTVSADAVDAVGVVGVQFLVDGAPFGAEDTTAPYAIDWTTTAVANGAHALSARARDAAGNTTTSGSVAVTVDNDTTAPTVAMSAPANGATVDGSITVSADALDAVGVTGVQFLLDGAPIGAEDTAAPYTIDWASTSATNGGHTLSARARDAAGNEAIATGVAITVSNDITAPTVAITAPANGATVNGIVTVTADAADEAGVAGVQFLLDGAPLGAEDTEAPYAIDWTTTGGGNGAHTVSARARDAAGNTTTAAASVTVANVPKLVITAPLPEATINGSTVPITYTTAGDLSGFAVDHVHFRIDGGPERMDTTMDGIHQLGNVPGGSHVLTGFLVRGDHSKIPGTDATPVIFSNIVPDTTAPTVTITAPSNGAAVNGTITISANATDAIGVVGVQFLLDGAPFGDEDTVAPYSIDWTTTGASNGTHTLSARARDAADNVGTAPNIAITVDHTAPTVAMTAPANGGIVSGTVTVSADAADAVGVAGVQFLVDDAPFGAEDTAAPYTIDWASVGAANGAHTLSARARDAAGNQTTAAGVSVTVDNLAPSVSVTAPGNGATLNGTVTVSANAADAVGVVGVQFLLDGAPLGAEDTTAPYAVDWVTTTAPNGAHAVSARARDAAGNTTTSTSVAVTLNNDTTVPTVAMTAPANGATVNGTITVSASATDAVGVVGVQFLLDGAALGAEDTTAPYSISWATTGVGNGAHTLSARARDAAANQSTATSVAITVNNDTTAPAVAMTAPANGETVNGTIAVSANATDAVGVVGVQFLLDGAALGAEDTSAPYSFNWATTGVTNGAHTLSARARDAAGNLTTATSVAVTVNNDIIAPVVTMTAPANGAIVSAAVTVSADASDAVGVVGVQFLLDGAVLGAEDTTAPYAISWTTTTATNGAHTLSARARDAAGNTTTSSGVAVTVSNALLNLVAAYSFDEGTGTSVSDTSGNNLNGTITAATWTTAGKYGKALSFNGTSALVTIADHALLDLTTGMTLEAWVYPTTLSNYRTVILKERPTDLAYAIYANDGAPRPSTWITAGASATAAGTSALTLNTWTHLAATYDGAVLRLYVNGLQVGSQARTGLLFVSGNPLRIGGNTVWGEYFAGRIDEVRVYSRALSATEIQSDMTVPVTPPATDTTPPTSAITSPAAGASVSGTISVAASATDNVGVVGVQFRLDGVNLGAEDTSAPYSVSWNTTTAALGPHTLTAVARDGAGNSTTSATVNVTVFSATDPSVVGQWGAPFELGVVAVNMALMHTGSVLMFSGEFATTGPERVWNPSTGTFVDVLLNRTNLFCAGHSQLADGRILVIGGHDPGSGLLGARDVNIFDPVTLSWSSAASMADPRWYPTATTLADGRVLALSGGTTCLTCIADVPEVYNPLTNTWSRLTGARLAFPYYPFTYLLPDGRILNAGANEQPVATRALNLTTQTWTMIDPVVVDGHSSAMYRPGQILKSGTATDSGGTGNAAATAYVIDMNQPSPTWRQIPSMANARAFHNTTLLPTGDVLVTGGMTQRDGYFSSSAVYDAELWSPATETWRTLSRAQLPRLYHSGSLLLPDGRVLIAGGGNDGPAVNYTRGELYSPPYLFKGPRPTITSVPAETQYGSTFVVDTPDAAAITAVSLMRPGAVTHSFDEDQRFLNLSFTRETGRLLVTAPANGNLAPPGYYMLFLVAGEVPSTARFVRLPSPAEDDTPPTPPGALSATPGVGTATLDWSASTDDTAVVAYNLHRATTSSFTPSPANRIAHLSATSYVDTLPGGTYYYVATAEDANGNVSAPSNVASAAVLGDISPPEVTIDAPSDGAEVSGSIAIAATASDDIGVVGVQFEIDLTPIGAEDTSAPYSINWPSTATTNGVHQLTAVARDAQGHQTRSVPVTITVSNAQTPGLIAAFGFNEASGSIVNDLSGNGNNGQMTNAVRSPSGRYGGALSFNGTSSIVTVADAASLDLTTGMTLSAWVRPSALSGWRTVLLKERPASLSYALYAHSTASRPAGYVANPGDTGVTGTSALALNTWTHLTLTYDGSVLILYVNGVEVNRVGPAGAILTSTGALSIGGNNVWGEFFSGLIDEVRVYNRALSPTEIQTDMNTPVGGS
jgi:hypothetical protein